MKIEQLTTSASTPRWAGETGQRRTLLSGGAKLDGTAFPLDAQSKRNIRSGTLVSRDSVNNAATYVAFNPAFASHGFIWLDVTDTAANPDVELYIAGEVRLDRLPTTLTTEQVNALKQQFTFTTGNK